MDKFSNLRRLSKLLGDPLIILCCSVLLLNNVLGFVPSYGVKALTFGWPLKFGGNSLWVFDVDSPEMRPAAPWAFVDHASFDSQIAFIIDVGVGIAVFAGIFLFRALSPSVIHWSLRGWFAVITAASLWIKLYTHRHTGELLGAIWSILDCVTLILLGISVMGYLHASQIIAGESWKIITRKQ